MLVKMKKTTPVSTTGLNNLVWKKGEVYEAPVDLAKNLVKGDLAAVKKGVVIPEVEPEVKVVSIDEPAAAPGKSDEPVLDLDPNKDGIIEIDE